MKNIIFLLLFYLGVCTLLQAQFNMESLFEKKIENIIEKNESTLKERELYETLFELHQNPININEAYFEPLISVGLLNAYQASILGQYVEVMGEVVNINEILFLDGFSNADLDNLLPFICLKKKNQPFQLGRINQEFNFGFIKPLQKSLAYHNGMKKYAGTNEKFYCRFKLKSKDQFSLNLIGEKDSGEQSTKPDSKFPFLFDYRSYNIRFQSKGIIKQILLGDYHIQFGQGLCLWSNYAFNKSANINELVKYPKGIFPNTSGEENNYFRGAATTFGFSKFKISAFISSKYRDANIVNDTAVSSLQNSGLHRTLEELEDKHSIREFVFGGNIQYRFHRAQIGFTYYKQGFNKSIISDRQPYSQFSFQGKTNQCIGIDYRFIFLKFELFGELCQSINKAYSFIQGVNFYALSIAKFHLHYRIYDKAFQNLYAQGISENSKNKNEQSLFLATELQLFPKCNLSTYIDFFNFPFLKYSLDFPTSGNEEFIQLCYHYSDRIQFYLRIKRESKFIKQENKKVWFDYPEKKISTSFRFHITYQINSLFNFQSRVEIKRIQTGKLISKGFLLFQQLSYHSLNNKLSCTVKLASFNTDKYDSRIYMYEHDLRNILSIPAFFGKGNRFYLFVYYKLNKHLRISLKYAQSYYYNKTNIGSGLDAIEGNIKSEIKTELILKI